MSEVQENGIQRAMRVTEELRAELAAEKQQREAAEQENARLREGIQAMHKRANAVKYNQISLAWVLNELAALLAQPEAKGEPDA